ncbi:MAG: maltose alpha-D-glucosyltransferase, partial [Candidatus Hydrogenedentota bacterium]
MHGGGDKAVKGSGADDWYKDAVIYELHVRAFRDIDGDGIGDFRGLTEKLDYLHDLGVSAIWLLPFFPSPLRDDGYDIGDYCDVLSSYGTLADFKILLREAHERGLKVVTELVMNHTSDQHAWFQRARYAPPGSVHRDFYVWCENSDKYKDARIIFKDFEQSNWTWDPVAQAYYWHRFYSHQPDLNFDNPAVIRGLFKVVDFWFDLGVDALRLDAIPYLYEREGTSCENLPETHAFLKQLRRHVDRKFRGRMLLAEANQWPEDAAAYFGEGDECHMSFHFPIMPRLFMALSMEDRLPVIDILEQTPEIPSSSQWALFLRNHDELTLEMVTDEERDYMWRMYAHETHARINLGIRRRLAPLLKNNRRRIELLNSLLFSLPGTPVIYYGDELGMGDNVYLGDRNGVRTPMQWSPDRNAGFSEANPQRLYLPVNIDPEYHYETVNVESQLSNPSSLLWWMTRMISLRKRHPAFSRGTIEFLRPANHKVLCFLRKHDSELLLVVANLSRFVQYVELDLSAFTGMVPVEMIGGTEFPVVTQRSYFLSLGPHAFMWFELSKTRAAVALEHRPIPEVTFTVDGRWDAIFADPALRNLEEALPEWLMSRQSLAGQPRQITAANLVDLLTPSAPEAQFRIAIVEVRFQEDVAETHVLPIGFADGRAAEKIRERAPR